MTCPMTCPKTLRNGPCGGVREDGNCEVKPEMRCVWVKAEERARTLPLLPASWRGHFHELRPPVDNRLSGTSAWVNLVSGRDRERPRGLVARGGTPVSLRELVEAGDRLILTGEAPSVDGGPLEAFHERIAEMAHVGGRDERDRQHGRARSRLERRRRDRPPARRGRADHAGRLPRQEPARHPGGHRRRCAARRREHLLPDRGRRHRRRRARGDARVRPRRPAAHSRRDRCSHRAATSPDARSSPAPRLFVGAVENAAAPAARTSRASGRRRRSRPARASCSCRSAYHPERLEAFVIALDGSAA